MKSFEKVVEIVHWTCVVIKHFRILECSNWATLQWKDILYTLFIRITNHMQTSSRTSFCCCIISWGTYLYMESRCILNNITLVVSAYPSKGELPVTGVQQQILIPLMDKNRYNSCHVLRTSHTREDCLCIFPTFFELFLQLHLLAN